MFFDCRHFLQVLFAYCQKEGCHNYVGGKRCCRECVEIKRTKKKESKKAWNAAFCSNMTCYGPDTADFGVRLLTEVSKAKPIIVPETPIFSRSNCNAINQWIYRSLISILSINWDDHNGTSRYVMYSLCMCIMLILIPGQCS